jgi:hypothetical protein
MISPDDKFCICLVASHLGRIRPQKMSCVIYDQQISKSSFISDLYIGQIQLPKLRDVSLDKLASHVNKYHYPLYLSPLALRRKGALGRINTSSNSSGFLLADLKT